MQRGDRLSNGEPDVRERLLRGAQLRSDSVRVLLLDRAVRSAGASVLSQRAVQLGAHLRRLEQPCVQPGPALRRRDVQRERDVLDVRWRLSLRLGAGVLERNVRDLSHGEPDMHGQLLLGAQLQRDSVRVLLRLERVWGLGPALLLQRAVQRRALVRRLGEPRVSLSDHSQSTFELPRRER
jgi:hypothetical protein